MTPRSTYLWVMAVLVLSFAFGFYFGHHRPVQSRADLPEDVDVILAGMTLEQKVGQMVMAGFPGTSLSREATALIKNHHVGGVILFSRNVENPAQIANMTRALQQTAMQHGAGVPLFIATDQEGGAVVRIEEGMTPLPGNMALGATRSSAHALALGRVIGAELKAVGVNMNFAPVLDVNNNSANPVIGLRSFGEHPDLVAQLGRYVIEGMQQEGVSAAGKHFPGHGDTATDSHVALPTINHGRDRLDQVELVPFQAAIEAGVDLIMTAHITFPAVDPTPGLPATLSHRVLTDLLRKEMGFDGLIITDAMEMDAIVKNFGLGDAAVRAVEAGVDIVLVAWPADWYDAVRAVEAIVDAVKSGRLSEDRIDASVRRILGHKQARGILNASWDGVGEKSDLLQHPRHADVVRDIARDGITVVRDEKGLLPLNLADGDRVLVVTPQLASLAAKAAPPSMSSHLGVEVSERWSDVREIVIPTNPSATDRQGVVAEAADADIIVVGTYRANEAQGTLVRALLQLGKPTVAVALGEPYDLVRFPDAPVYVATYGYRALHMEALAQILFGEAPARGRLPVSIPELYDEGDGLVAPVASVSPTAALTVAAPNRVRPGIELLFERYGDLVRGKRVGIITNMTGVTSDGVHIADWVMAHPDVTVSAFFAPEHGLRGDRQAGEAVASYTDEQTGIPVYSLYGSTMKPTPDMLQDVDVLLFDIQDVGARFYTYIYTMAYAMQAAAENNKPFVVLDRPNPIGGQVVEGPVLREPFSSFVGLYPIPMRHGMTVGELALYFNGEFNFGTDLTVVPVDGWRRSMWFDETGLPWIPPSPNMVTLQTATVYPGMALVEGTNVSEGRGTDRPFEIVGAPWIDGDALAAALNDLGIPGARFIPATFTPTFSKFEGERSSGIQLEVTDRRSFRANATGMYVLQTIQQMYPEYFAWRPPSGGRYFIDLLAGSDALREELDAGTDVPRLVAQFQGDVDDFLARRETYLLYD